MDRRSFLRNTGWTGVLCLLAGCSTGNRRNGESPTDRPNEGDLIVIDLEDDLDTACENDRATPTATLDACDTVSFQSPSHGPVSTVTTEAGETPYEGTFDDYFEVTLQTQSEQSLELRGCVHGLFEGDEEKIVPVNRTIPEVSPEYRLRIGPFVHPGGFDWAHLWIEGCRAAVEYPSSPP